MTIDEAIRICKLHDITQGFWKVVLEALEFQKKGEDDGH